MTSVAFVGLGGMGSRMAARLVSAGHDVAVWNRTAAKAAPLVELGATAADTAAAAAERAEVAITMLADPDALRAVTEGPDGVLAGLRQGATLVEMSTVGPAAIGALEAQIPSGVGLIDAPVLGSLDEAASGSLAIFVGGPQELFDRHSALLAELGTPLRVGGLGSGAAAKLVANSTLLGALGVLGEALLLARSVGLSDEAAFAVLARTPVAAQAERRRPAIEAGDYPRRFPLALARKDADLISDASAAAGVELPLVEAERRRFAAAEAAGWGDRDYAAILEWILRGEKP